MYYLNARYYNPEWGRFISPDPALDTSNAIGCNMFAYCGNDPVNRIDESGAFWNFVVGAIVGALAQAISTALDAYEKDGWDAFTSGKTWAKIGVSAVSGAINGVAAASGVGLLAAGTISAGTSAFETLGHELIDNDFTLTEESWGKIGDQAVTGFIGGLIGGKGAIHDSKYMLQQTGRFLGHIGSDGFRNAVSFFYKMTANYSKQFVLPTLWGFAKGFFGGKLAQKTISSLFEEVS